LQSVSNGLYFNKLAIKDLEIEVNGRVASFLGLKEFVKKLDGINYKEEGPIKKIIHNNKGYDFVLSLTCEGP